MASFEYSPFVNPYAASIGELLLHQHDAAAHAAEAIGGAQAHAADVTGQAWAGAAQGVGQAVGGAIQTATDPRRQLEAEQLRQTQNTQKFTGVVNNIVANLMTTNPDGSRTIDRTKAQAAFAQANVPLPVQQATFKQLDDLDASVQKFQKLRVDHAADAAHAAIGMIDAGMDPQTAVAGTMSYVRENGMASDQELAPLAHMVANASSPDDIKRGLIGIRGLSENYKDLSKPVFAPRESPGYMTGGDFHPLAPASSAQPEANVVFKDDKGVEHPVVFDKATKTYLFNGKDVTGQVTRPEAKDTAGQQTDRYLKILTAKKLGEAISPEDAAWAQSFEHNKMMGPEAASAAASLRQANTIAEQNALQRRSQEFQEAQAGRSELTTKIEQPYLDAREKADTLRGVIAAAQHGNMEAAAVQKLMGTLGVVTMEGVKRINTAEMDQVGGAGSLLTEIKSKVGKVVAGQPLPADLQKDLGELSTLLEKGARQKYEQGFKQVRTRYGLKDERQIPPPNAPNEGTEGVVNGKPAIWKNVDGAWGWVAK